jgi:hypothetical protein
LVLLIVSLCLGACDPAARVAGAMTDVIAAI